MVSGESTAVSMSEAARRTYFHFTPTPTPGQGGEWRPSPPESAGIYWVAVVPIDREPLVSLVRFDPGTKHAAPAGSELLEDQAEPPPISLDRIQAWWSGRLEPPTLPERAS